MNYRLRYWHELFEALIELHMVNGNEFNREINDGKGNWVKTKRTDHDSDTPWPLLRYEIHYRDTTITYSVDNQPEGGTKTTLVSIAEYGGRVRMIDDSTVRDEINERIMRDAYIFAVGMFNEFWFD